MPHRPRALELGMATYLVKKRLIKREQRFPFTLMLEPLEICNLACHGCGRIREYEHVFHKRMPVEECLRVAEEAGAPIVNIPGGEPMIHKEIDEIVNGIIAQGRFVYMCTNGLLMNRAFGRIPPSSHFAFVVHLDGMREVHDHAVDREGVFDKATAHMREAIELGYRVCTNTTIYRGVAASEYVELFAFLKEMGIEGCITSPGYDYESVTHDREQFLARTEAQALYAEVHELLRPTWTSPSTTTPSSTSSSGQAQLPVHARGRCPPTPSRAGGARATCSPTSTSAASRSCTRAPTGRPTARTATRVARTA